MSSSTTAPWASKAAPGCACAYRPHLRRVLPISMTRKDMHESRGKGNTLNPWNGPHCHCKALALAASHCGNITTMYIEIPSNGDRLHGSSVIVRVEPGSVSG